jgi:hypothetical protein
MPAHKNRHPFPVNKHLQTMALNQHLHCPD